MTREEQLLVEAQKRGLPISAQPPAEEGPAPYPTPGTIVDDPSKAADALAIQQASLPEDIEAKISVYARHMLPGVAPETARRAFEVRDGEIYRRGIGPDMDKLYPVVPRNYSPNSLYKRFQQGVGPAVTVGPPAAVGLATAPMMLAGPAGMAASVSATGGAGAGAQALREWLASKVSDQDPSALRVLREGGTAALSQGVGAGMTAWAEKNAVKDIARLDRPAADALMQKAQRQGIQLTPGEATNLSSLKTQQKALGNLPASADDMAAFYEKRAGQVSNRVGQVLDDISPQDSAEAAGAGLKKAAQGAIDTAVDARRQVARPVYEGVVKPENLVPDEAFKAIKDDKFLAREIAKVKSDDLYAMGEMPDNAMPVLDQVKKNLDDMVKVAERAGENNRARLLKDKLSQLLGVTDEAFADYPAARAAFAGKSPEVDALKDGVVGAIAKLPDEKAQQAAAKLFNPETVGPRSVAAARDALEKADPDAWQAIKRSWLQQQWEKAGKEFASTSGTVNQGPKFRAAILGDENRRRMLRAALKPNEWQAVNDLAEVLEAAGRVKPIGSDTAWNQEIMREMRQPGPVARVAGAVLSPTKWGEMLRDWSAERAVSSKAQDLTRIITSPDSMRQLRELRQISPTGARFRVGVAQLLGFGASEGAEAGVEAVGGIE